MSKREEHLFLYRADQIAEAAKAEAEYHEGREAHWTERRDGALQIVERTIGAKVERVQVTGGYEARIVVDYGDKGAWDEFQTATHKIEQHRHDAELFRAAQNVYGAQGQREYELDGADVMHFRFGGQSRAD